MKALNVALAVAGGVLVGTAVGLLVAPKSGKETRYDIKKYLKSKCPKLGKQRVDALVEKIEADLAEA